MPTTDKPDMLYGLSEIAEHLGITRGQAKHRAATAQIPTFKMGQTVCALRSEIDKHLRAAALAAQHRPPQGC